MKAVRSHVLVEFDKDDKQTIQRVFERICTIQQTWFDISRVFTQADFGDQGWEFKDAKNPRMAKTKLLDDIRKTKNSMKVLDQMLDDLQEKVKETK